MALVINMVIDDACPHSVLWLPMTDKKVRKVRKVKTARKSRSAAKRDAVWLSEIADNQDAKALSDLFEIYGPKLKGWLMARGIGSGTAEDIVQDVMIKVWTRAGTFDPEKASFATWVYRLTRNQLIDHKRKHSRMDVRDPELMKIIADDSVPSAESNYMQGEAEDELRAEMKKLSSDQKSVLRMAYMEFKTHKEIAKESGIPLGTVKTRIRSAVKSLKDKMGDR